MVSWNIYENFWIVEKVILLSGPKKEVSSLLEDKNLSFLDNRENKILKKKQLLYICIVLAGKHLQDHQVKPSYFKTVKMKTLRRLKSYLTSFDVSYFIRYNNLGLLFSAQWFPSDHALVWVGGGVKLGNNTSKKCLFTLYT